MHNGSRPSGHGSWRNSVGKRKLIGERLTPGWPTKHVRLRAGAAIVYSVSSPCCGGGMMGEWVADFFDDKKGRLGSYNRGGLYRRDRTQQRERGLQNAERR